MKDILTVETGLLFLRGFICPKMFVCWSPFSRSRLCLLLPPALLTLFLRLRLAVWPSIVMVVMVLLGRLSHY